ncbi:MAG: hypothetical protein P0116_15950 [Candidatus Nitrosocosmicus sp.]|nr:hypothetical protein [Candidatus Nitrosocosmicus sp.]
MDDKKSPIKAKPIKIKQFYKEIGVTKLLYLKYAGSYRNYSEFMSPYIYVFFNEKTHEKVNIHNNKIIEWAWEFKESYIYQVGFNELNEMISLRNRNKYLCYYRKPNKIYFIDFERKIKKWVNRPSGAKQPFIEEFLIKV